MEITYCKGHRKMHRGVCTEAACAGCGRVECLCAELAATTDCQTCDGDQVIVTCGECEGGEVDCETCPACQGAYCIPCPDCG